jgi:gamma-glutamylcyclotransferase (GGCT)/AIG2-like uncharacterized protein YtfP
MLYFAYGSNLNLPQMQRRCAGYVIVGRATLNDHTLVFPRRYSSWNGGVAGIQPSPGEKVEGAVYDLTETHMASLDRYEGVADHHYERRNVTVQFPDGRREQVITYFALPQPGEPFKPSKKYMTTIIDGAEAHGLPADYIAKLRAIETCD